MGVIVDMLLSSERLAILLEGDAEVDIEVIVGESSSLIIAAILGVSRIVSILDKTAGILTISLLIDASIDKRQGEILGEIELTGEVDHRTSFPLAIDHKQGRDRSGLSHFGVVGTESRCDMHDTGTIFGGDIIAGDNAESALRDFDERIIGDLINLIGMSSGILT